MRIGVLASQGAFVEHIAILQQPGVEALPVRLPQELDGLDGLIIPGGESTPISKLMLDYNLTNEISNLAKNGLPIFGTCAGMILLATETPGSEVKPFPAVFIRAPIIEQVNSGVEILAKLADGTIVAARQGKLLASAFHPELTDDLRFHRYFLDIVADTN